MYSASSRHQEIVGFLGTILRLFTEGKYLGRVLTAPYPMKLEKIGRGREPDLLFVLQENVHLIKSTYLDGPADVVAEIISPESVKRDREEKFFEYQAAGVKEYWLIDYEQETAEFYRLNEQGIYELMPSEEVFHSQIVKGFFLRKEWFWGETLPTLEALRELKILH